MSERPTDTQPSRAAAAHGHGRGERAQYARAGTHAHAGGPSVAQRAANFRQGAPFLVERATLYDPEPLELLAPTHVPGAPPPRRLLPVALTLLGVVVVVGLASGVMFVRNADVVRHDDGDRRREVVSDRARPPEGPAQTPGVQPNATTLAYDLTRRSNDAIVGAWRPGSEDSASERSETPAAQLKRRSLPRRISQPVREVPPEVVTRPVAAVSPRYDPPEPKRRLSDAEQVHRAQEQPIETAAVRPSGLPPASAGSAPADEAERPGASVVARVGRASEPVEAEGPAVTIPLEKLALPLRRPDPAMLEERHERRSARGRRSRVVQLQRQLRRKQRHALKNDPAEIRRAREASFGDWFVGTQRHRP